MRKDDITRLVAIQGLSVRRIKFSKEVIHLETRKKEEKFYHKKGWRVKVMRKVPKKVKHLIPRVGNIYLKRDEVVYHCYECGEAILYLRPLPAIHRARPAIR